MTQERASSFFYFCLSQGLLSAPRVDDGSRPAERTLRWAGSWSGPNNAYLRPRRARRLDVMGFLRPTARLRLAPDVAIRLAVKAAGHRHERTVPARNTRSRTAGAMGTSKGHVCTWPY